MRKALENRTWLWFLTPEMARIFAEIIWNDAENL